RFLELAAYWTNNLKLSITRVRLNIILVFQNAADAVRTWAEGTLGIFSGIGFGIYRVMEAAINNILAEFESLWVELRAGFAGAGAAAAAALNPINGGSPIDAFNRVRNETIEALRGVVRERKEIGKAFAAGLEEGRNAVRGAGWAEDIEKANKALKDVKDQMDAIHKANRLTADGIAGAVFQAARRAADEARLARDRARANLPTGEAGRQELKISRHGVADLHKVVQDSLLETGRESREKANARQLEKMATYSKLNHGQLERMNDILDKRLPDGAQFA
ncbi:MAG: hypothetical protein K2V38_24980, partial [Gemmataceae bacterium]|nr:hypothetical protein [Gemmataceae bacterium]